MDIKKQWWFGKRIICVSCGFEFDLDKRSYMWLADKGKTVFARCPNKPEGCKQRYEIHRHVTIPLKD